MNPVFKHRGKVVNSVWSPVPCSQAHTEASDSSLFPEGCPGFCNNNGRCTLEASGWHCICQAGWRGAGCHVAMETLCTDGKDNEGGTLVRVTSSSGQPLMDTCFLLLACLLCAVVRLVPTAASFPPVFQTAWWTVWTLTAACSFPVRTTYTAKDPLIRWRCSACPRLH